MVWPPKSTISKKTKHRQTTSPIHFSLSSFRNWILDGCKTGYICLSAPNPGTSGPSSTAQPDTEVTTGPTRQKGKATQRGCPAMKPRTEKQSSSQPGSSTQHGQLLPRPSGETESNDHLLIPTQTWSQRGAGSTMPAVHVYWSINHQLQLHGTLC